MAFLFPTSYIQKSHHLCPTPSSFLMSHYYPSMEEEDHHQEMQLLSPQSAAASSPPPSWPSHPSDRFESGAPPLDLQLSISVTPLKPPSDSLILRRKDRRYKDHKRDGGGSHVEALKWQAAEQIRLAAMEKAYAERVRELTRIEMELAQSEFARAHSMWERAREEVERAEKRMKERAVDLEITCQSCRHKFIP